MITKSREIMTDWLSEDSNIQESEILGILEKQFNTFLNSKYPELQEEGGSIKEDIFRWVKKFLRKQNELTDVEAIQAKFLERAQVECKQALPTEENRKKNLGLTRKEFKSMLKELQEGDEKIIETVYLSHFDKCTSYLRRQHGCNEDEAHEASLDALLEIRKDLIEEKIFYGNLAYYFTYRAKSKLFKMRSKKKTTFSSMEEVDIPDEEMIERNLQQEELNFQVAEAMKQLSSECRSILRQYYFEDLNLKEIAQNLGKSHDAVRQEARRCRNKLRKYLGETFYEKFQTES